MKRIWLYIILTIIIILLFISIFGSILQRKNKLKQINQKIIYLTIDDCPSDNFREKIDFLYSKNIPAIFFCLGNQIEGKEDNIVYAIKKGYIIGNHSYTHPFFSLISSKDAFNEIKKTDDLIEKAYQKAKVKRKVKLFRFPYGDKGYLKILSKNKIQNYLKKLGYKNIDSKDITNNPITFIFRKDIDLFWTCDFEDWTDYNTKKGRNKILEDLKSKKPKRCSQLNNNSNIEILLLHDFSGNQELFKDIIEKLLEKGILFKLPKII